MTGYLHFRRDTLNVVKQLVGGFHGYSQKLWITLCTNCRVRSLEGGLIVVLLDCVNNVQIECSQFYGVSALEFRRELFNVVLHNTKKTYQNNEKNATTIAN